jgi:hypothetical protein
MTEAPIKGGKPGQLRQQATRTKRGVEAKRALKDERVKRVEELPRESSKQLAGIRILGEDDYSEQLDRDVVRVREATRIDNDDFCRGIVRQLYRVTADRKADFDFMLSVLKDLDPVDKIHAMLAVNVVVSQLALMRVGESLLKPITFELPTEFVSACHRARWDFARLDKQKIQIDDQPIREWGARMYNKLSQTFHMHLQAFSRYRTVDQPLRKPQHAIHDTSSMNGAATMPGILNGKQAQP